MNLDRLHSAANSDGQNFDRSDVIEFRPAFELTTVLSMYGLTFSRELSY